MNIDDIVYVIYLDHVCECKIKGIFEDNKGDVYYTLYDYYHNKEIPFDYHCNHVYLTPEEIIEKHIKITGDKKNER